MMEQMMSLIQTILASQQPKPDNSRNKQDESDDDFMDATESRLTTKRPISEDEDLPPSKKENTSSRRDKSADPLTRSRS